MGFQFPWLLLLVAFAFPLWLLLGRSDAYTRKVLHSFRDHAPSQKYTLSRRVLAVTFTGSLALVAADPFIAPQATAEYLFLSDTSRSMEARNSCSDQTFLERSKVVMRDVIDGVPEGKFGIVAFDRLAFPVTQLTYDHSYLKEVLSNGLFIGMSYRATGTDLGNALSVIAQKKRDLPELYGRVRYIILTSDGNLANDEWKQTLEGPLKELKQADIRVIAVGIGNPVETAIPITNDGECRKELIEVDGQTVRIPLRTDILKQIANETQGAYFGEVQTDKLVKYLRDKTMAVVPEGAEFREEQRKSIGWVFLIPATCALFAFLLL